MAIYFWAANKNYFKLNPVRLKIPEYGDLEYCASDVNQTSSQVSV